MKKNFLLFRYAKQLNEKFTTFLMNITAAGELFKQATAIYLKKQNNRAFIHLKEQISALESENDTLRREIEAELYRQMILPGMRSDILDLMEGCDRIINQYEKIGIIWCIEHAKIPVDFYDDTMELIAKTLDCVGALMTGVQSFFDGQMNVEEEVQECYYLEHVVDNIAICLKEKIFEKKIPLARQLQLKEFVSLLEQISDLSESVADKLKIISVKHAL